MSARGFGSVMWAGAVAGGALGFYLVSLRVASERAALEDVESRIAMTQRDIRLLQTEIGTRGRLAQLERWNVKFIRLSAPTADQFVDGGFQLATLVKPMPKPAIEAPVVYASARIAPADGQPRLTGDTAEVEAVAPPPSRPVSEMIHVASYAVPEKKPNAAAMLKPVPAKPIAVKFEASTAKAATKSVPAMKPVKTATADPLAPLSDAKLKAKAATPVATAGRAAPERQSKDSDSD